MKQHCLIKVHIKVTEISDTNFQISDSQQSRFPIDHHSLAASPYRTEVPATFHAKVTSERVLNLMTDQVLKKGENEMVVVFVDDCTNKSILTICLRFKIMHKLLGGANCCSTFQTIE